MLNFSSCRINDWTYELPFDVNFKDVTGQTPIYLASLLGNLKMVEIMLKFKVKATRTKVSGIYFLVFTRNIIFSDSDSDL